MVIKNEQDGDNRKIVKCVDRQSRSISFDGENKINFRTRHMSSSNASLHSSSTGFSSDEDDVCGGYRSADDAVTALYHRRRKRSGTWP